MSEREPRCGAFPDPRAAQMVMGGMGGAFLRTCGREPGHLPPHRFKYIPGGFVGELDEYPISVFEWEDPPFALDAPGVRMRVDSLEDFQRVYGKRTQAEFDATYDALEARFASRGVLGRVVAWWRRRRSAVVVAGLVAVGVADAVLSESWAWLRRRP